MPVKHYDLTQLNKTVEHFETLVKRIDDATTAIEEAERELSESTDGSKSSLQEATQIVARLRAIWHEERHWAAPQSARATRIRDLTDRVEAVVKRLTPPVWNGNVRVDPHQTVYRLGSR
jgi:uncharacterized protein YukE